jgi:hypothetical protein
MKPTISHARAASRARSCPVVCGKLSFDRVKAVAASVAATAGVAAGAARAAPSPPPSELWLEALARLPTACMARTHRRAALRAPMSAARRRAPPRRSPRRRRPRHTPACAYARSPSLARARAALLAAPAPSLAQVKIINLQDGASVSSPVHLDFGVRGLQVLPASGSPWGPLGEG